MGGKGIKRIRRSDPTSDLIPHASASATPSLPITSRQQLPAISQTKARSRAQTVNNVGLGCSSDLLGGAAKGRVLEKATDREGGYWGEGRQTK